MKIHSLRAAVGFLILFLSIILFLNTSGLVSWGIWLFVWQFWPFSFVIFGAAFLMRRWNFNFFIGISIFIVIFSVLSGGVALTWSNQYFKTENFAEENTKTVMETKISNELPQKAEEADVKMILGGSKIRVAAMDDNGFLYEGRHSSNFFRLNERLEVIGGKTKLTLKTSPLVKEPFSPKSINELNINFSQKPEYSFDINSGASALDLDFENLKVKNLDLDAGASEVKIKLGERSDTDIKIRSGANSLQFYVPQNSGIKISSKSALLSNNFRDFGLVKKDKTWGSKDYSKTKNKINIELESGVSKIELLQ